VGATPSGFKLAYTLLPPPLAAIPAKRWTSISLLLHSYTVARTFEELVKAYSTKRENLPSTEEAFIIGLLHDVGQKLQVRGKPSDEKITKWVIERLEVAGLSRDEVNYYIKYLTTNPAETASDPSYSREAWALLKLADLLQGVGNPLEIAELVSEINRGFGLGLAVKSASIMIPQAFLRTLFSRVLYDELNKLANDTSDIIVPISTPLGAVILSDNPNMKIEVNWDSIAVKNLVPDPEKFELFAECCENKECLDKYTSKKKSGEKELDKRYKGITRRDCTATIYPGQKVSAYKITLAYYSDRKLGLKIYLPSSVKDMFQGVELKGVEYRDGDYVCPLCGLKTPVGTAVDFLKTFSGKLTPEQWCRRYYPGNVNVIASPGTSLREYAIDPLCLGDTLVRIGLKDILVALKFKASMPTLVLRDVGSLTYNLIYILGSSYGIPKWFESSNSRGSVLSLLNYESEGFEDILDEVGKPTSSSVFLYDMFSTTLYVPYRDELSSHQEEWVRDIMTAGVLASWGLYPITISDVIAFDPSEKLLTYYKGQRALYDFAPSEWRLRSHVPYVAVAMAGLSYLDYMKNVENTPAYLEVLDYPPDYARILATYSSPHLYALIERTHSYLGGS